MKNKNKFTIIISTLGMLIVSMLLNSCGGMNGNHMNGDHTNSRNNEGYDKVSCLCPVCKGGCRYLYRLSNKDLVLLCEECSSVWLGTKNLDRDGVANDDMLKEKFKVKDPEELFEEDARWAKNEEANQSTTWKKLKKKY